MSFDLYPAIDLRDGRCVRLLQGDFNREIRYDDDPVEVALSFEAAGAPWIHLVDLDAARSGTAQNLSVVANIAEAVGVPVQAGGGVRSAEAAQALYDVGITRCVIGTAAIENPGLVSQLASSGHRVALGLDVLGDEVMIRGWERGSARTVFEVLPEFVDVGADAVVVTQIRQDGMGQGADVTGLSAVLAAASIPVIASGGVGSLEHIRDLGAIEVDGRSLIGVIAGKAIHDGTISVADAILATEPSGVSRPHRNVE